MVPNSEPTLMLKTLIPMITLKVPVEVLIQETESDSGTVNDLPSSVINMKDNVDKDDSTIESSADV